MKKNVLLMAGIIAVLSTGMISYADSDEIGIIVNGQRIETDTAPIIENDRTLVPVRAVSEALDCDVGWIEDKRAVVVFDGVEMAFLWIDKDGAFKIDGVSMTGSYKMDVSPKIINDRTMIPIRCVSELLGAEVDWDETERNVIIDYEPNDFDIADGMAVQLSNSYIDELTDMYDAYYDYAFEKKNVTKAEIELDGGKIIELELYNEIAPVSVENFIKLAESGAYNGKIFHRVIEDFMIQGGASDENGNFSESDNIYGEFIRNGYMNLIPHERGVISMARASSYDSGSNQFFIMHVDYPFLNGDYAAFGKVTKGMEYVDEIAVSETDENDKPVENKVIKEVRIIK